MFIGYKLWEGQKHYLNKMTLAELVKAYFCYPAIQAYILLAGVSTVLTVFRAEGIWTIVLAAGAGFLVYPLAWYLLHRFILHGSFLYKSPRTATLWKRIHYDHHRDPNDLGVLFGALKTTLPTIFVITVPVGWLIGGTVGSTAAFTAGLIITCFYEFCHCIQHLAYTPKQSYLRRIKKLHLAHHFHNENGNYGITNFFWDRVIGTYYSSTEKVPRSPTVFNLGYAGTQCERYPWVAELSPPSTETAA